MFSSVQSACSLLISPYSVNDYEDKYAASIIADRKTRKEILVYSGLLCNIRRGSLQTVSDLYTQLLVIVSR